MDGIDDALDGPLPIALYSAALFTLTEGRAYSRAEISSWMRDAGLTVESYVDTLVHCGWLTARRSPPEDATRTEINYRMEM